MYTYTYIYIYTYMYTYTYIYIQYIMCDVVHKLIWHHLTIDLSSIDPTDCTYKAIYTSCLRIALPSRRGVILISCSHPFNSPHLPWFSAVEAIPMHHAMACRICSFLTTSCQVWHEVNPTICCILGLLFWVYHIIICNWHKRGYLGSPTNCSTTPNPPVHDLL